MTKSPFPGMDPYLELHWRDVHHSLCTYARDALQPQVRPALLARIDEWLVVESEVASNRFSEAPTEGFIQIVDATNDDKLVTVIAFVSPTAKATGKGQSEYRRWRNSFRDSEVSVVEIDLIYSPTWVLRPPLDQVPPKLRIPYRICVESGWEPRSFYLYPLSIQQTLPKIGIPLGRHDRHAVLDLQDLIEKTYENGAYDQINYKLGPGIPDIPPEIADWISKTLHDAGRR
jgi:hypothetical protein